MSTSNITLDEATDYAAEYFQKVSHGGQPIPFLLSEVPGKPTILELQRIFKTDKAIAEHLGCEERIIWFWRMIKRIPEWGSPEYLLAQFKGRRPLISKTKKGGAGWGLGALYRRADPVIREAIEAMLGVGADIPTPLEALKLVVDSKVLDDEESQPVQHLINELDGSNWVGKLKVSEVAG